MKALLYTPAFILPGLIITVLVAWSCVRRVNVLAVAETAAVSQHDDHRWWLSVREARGATRVVSVRWFDTSTLTTSVPPPIELLPGWADFTEPTTEFQAGAEGAETRIADGRGWPFIALWAEILPHHRQLPDAVGQYPNIYPVTPAWPGFLLNTLFYSTGFWATLSLPLLVLVFVVRRWRRIKRCLCPRCAYPAGVSSICTECGRALPKALLKGRAAGS